MRFSRYGFHRDVLHETWSNASRLVHQLTNSGITDARLKKAQDDLLAARNAIRTRDLERKKTRIANKLLRAQGIDPTKKPKSMTAEEFDAARKTLRAAIQPQFPEYKQQVFQLLRARVDSWRKKLAEAKWDAYVAAYGADGYQKAANSYKVQDLAERRRLENVYENGNAMLKHFRKWTGEADLPKGGTRDRGRPEATDPRVARSDENINADLLLEAHAITERDFDSYTQKLAGKIAAPVSRAKLSQGQLWNNSWLTVILDEPFRSDTPDSQQLWHTKMILNFSVLGTPYNQWPTRRC